MALIVTFFLNKTDFGRAIRATSQDRDAALLQGIDIYRVYNITFGLSSAMVGVSGAFILPYYYLYPTVGTVFDIKAFVIVVLGGMGSMPGALVGGFIVGLVESLGGIFFYRHWGTDALLCHLHSHLDLSTHWPARQGSVGLRQTLPNDSSSAQ